MSFYEFVTLFFLFIAAMTYVGLKLEEWSDRNYVKKNPHRFSKMDREYYNI